MTFHRLRHVPRALAASAGLALAPEAAAETTLYETERFTFQSIGYLRAGIGYERDGDDQICLQNPGADAKYRLGNECEVFSELNATVGLNYSKEEPLFTITGRLSFLAASTNEFRDGDISLQELYAQYFFPPDSSLGGAALWVGSRFYRRFDIHINDFYYWRGTGHGVGFEKIPLPVGQASFAVFANAVDDVEEFNDDEDYLRLDARWETIPLWEGANLDVGGDLRFLYDETERGAEDPPSFGVHLGARLMDESAGPVSLATTLQVGLGAGSSLDNASALEADEDSIGARILTHALYNSEDGDWSAQAAGLFEMQSDGAEWLSFGVRPIYSFNRYVAVAVEPGIDVNWGDGDGLRVLGKGTLALLLRYGDAFFDRPEFRIFVTHAQFDDTARRLGIAPALDDDRNNATTFGIQIEHFY